MKIQTKATGILERTSHYLKSGVLKEKPAWYDVVGSHPPHIDLTKKSKLFDTDSQKQDPAITLTTRDELTGLYKTRLNKDDRKQKNRSVARVPKLQFLEDQLRDVFYHQHPWEFSRPKNLIERDGQDYKKCDWSHMLQLTKPLDGESVVQRTLWLLQDAKDTGKKLSFFEAYDQSRFEFYRLRLEEESESAISREESTMFGSVYPSSYIEWGLAQEQGHIDSWTKVAGDKMKVKLANREGKAAKSEAPEESFWESNFATDKA